MIMSTHFIVMCPNYVLRGYVSDGAMYGGSDKYIHLPGEVGHLISIIKMFCKQYHRWGESINKWEEYCRAVSIVHVTVLLLMPGSRGRRLFIPIGDG